MNRVQRAVLFAIKYELETNLRLTINQYCALVWIREKILRRAENA